MPLPFAQILRDFITDGVPSSGANKPKKSEMRAWGSWVESIIAAFTSNGGLIYSSLALLNADLSPAANRMAWVIGDATAANNGVYGKVGGTGTGSWTRRSDLPFSFIIGTDLGAGTANAIQVTTGIPVSTTSLIITSVFRVNTSSPVTISFNGGSPLTIKTNSGNDVSPGGLVANGLMFGLVVGSTFRLVSDQASAAVVAAAEAAAAVATTAKGDAEAARDDAVAAAGSVLFPVSYGTVQSLTNSQQAQARANIGVQQAGYSTGMVLSNNSGDVNNDIDISAGVRVADNGVNTIRLLSTMTKRLDAAWSSGSGNGGLDTGSKTASESYAIFAIGGASVSDDVLFSASFSAPVMPTGYTWKRYLGSIVTSASNNIFSFVQTGNYFRRINAGGGTSTATIGTSSSNVALSVPRGISCIIDLHWRTLNVSGNGFVFLRHPDDTDIAVAAPANANIGGVGTNQSFVGTIPVFSDVSRQVAARALLASTTLDLAIRGWTDPYV